MKHKIFFNSKGKLIESSISKYIAGETKNVFGRLKMGAIRKNISNSQTSEYSDAWAKLYDVTLLGSICSINGITQKDIEEMIMRKKTHSGIFFDDGSHMTWHFDLEDIPTMPTDVKVGDKVEVTIVGKYEDEFCSCDIVSFANVTHSPFNGNLLHITRTTNGINPYEVGVRATKNKQKIKKVNSVIVGTWGIS